MFVFLRSCSSSCSRCSDDDDDDARGGSKEDIFVRVPLEKTKLLLSLLPLNNALFVVFEGVFVVRRRRVVFVVVVETIIIIILVDAIVVAVIFSLFAV